VSNGASRNLAGGPIVRRIPGDPTPEKPRNDRQISRDTRGIDPRGRTVQDEKCLVKKWLRLVATMATRWHPATPGATPDTFRHGDHRPAGGGLRPIPGSPMTPQDKQRPNTDKFGNRRDGLWASNVDTDG
jgi:hypothetical protein